MDMRGASTRHVLDPGAVTALGRRHPDEIAVASYLNSLLEAMLDNRHAG